MENILPEISGIGRVLIVDDNSANRTLLVDILKAEGHEVRQAVDGRSGLEAVMSDPPDAVILDIMMPGRDGFELCRLMQEHHPTADVPVLITTALDDRQSRLRGIHAGARDFLTKPIDTRELCFRVVNAIKQKKAADRLRQALSEAREARLAQEFLSHSVVHDMRSLLGPIIVGTQFLRESTMSEHSEELEFLDGIERAARALRDMASSILDIYLAESGRLETRRESCELRPVFDDCVDTMIRLAGVTAGVSVEMDAKSRAVVADSSLLRRVVSNLISNALRHVPRNGGQVWLRAIPSDVFPDFVRIEVADNGPGVSPERRESLFNKEIGANREIEDSHGIGLYFCSLAVEAMGGQIGCDTRGHSGSGGQVGVVFYVLLPAAQVAQKEKRDDDRFPSAVPAFVEKSGGSPEVEEEAACLALSS